MRVIPTGRGHSMPKPHLTGPYISLAVQDNREAVAMVRGSMNGSDLSNLLAKAVSYGSRWALAPEPLNQRGKRR